MQVNQQAAVAVQEQIPVEGAAPAVEEAKPAVIIQFNPQTHYPKDFRFSFRKDELGNKRPTVDLQVPVPLASHILNNNDAKEIELLQNAIEDVVYSMARDIVNDNENINQENIDLSKLDWHAIAYLPKAERKGRGLPKELWEAFAADYISIMPGLTGNSLEHVSNAATHLVRKFQSVKTMKKGIKKLLDYLDLWFTSTTNAEQFQEVYDFLSKKGNELLELKEDDLIATF